MKCSIIEDNDALRLLQCDRLKKQWPLWMTSWKFQVTPTACWMIVTLLSLNGCLICDLCFDESMYLVIKQCFTMKWCGFNTLFYLDWFVTPNCIVLKQFGFWVKWNCVSQTHLRWNKTSKMNSVSLLLLCSFFEKTKIKQGGSGYLVRN